MGNWGESGDDDDKGGADQTVRCISLGRRAAPNPRSFFQRVELEGVVGGPCLGMAPLDEPS